MTTAKKKIEKNENASVVGGKLILSFPEAITPVIWQLDLNEAKSSSFEVNTHEKGFGLFIKMAGASKKEIIAPFSTKDEAVTGLVATSEALKQAYSHDNYAASEMKSAPGQPYHQAPAIASAQAPAQAPAMYPFPYPQQARKKGIGKWIVIVLCFAVIGFLFFALSQMQPNIATTASGSASTASSASTQSAPPSSGVPVSADEFLRSR